MAKPLPNFQSELSELIPFSRVRLIAIDVDGTLLGTKGEIGTQVPAFIRKLSAMGRRVKVTIATGRAFAGASPLIHELNPVRDVPVILYNGSVVLSPHALRTIEHRTIPMPAVKDVVSIATEAAADALVYTIGKPLFAGMIDPICEIVFGFSKLKQGEGREFNGLPVRWLCDPSQLPALETAAILLETKGGSAHDLVRALRGVNISVTSSGSRYIEIRPHGVNKGTALETLSAYLNIERDRVLAVGDNDNDIEMLRWAGIGVAVKTSSDAALANSDYVCPWGPQEAIIEVLNFVKEAHRLARGTPLTRG